MKMRICWIVGNVLLIATVAFLGIFIPRHDNEIERIQVELAGLENMRAVRLEIYQHFLSSQLIEGQRRIDVNLMKLLKEKESIQSANVKLRKEFIGTVSKYYSLLTGKTASAELKKKWALMNVQQLQAEADGWVKQQKLNILYDNIEKKNLELTEAKGFRQSILLWITIVQIIGLLIINWCQYFKDYAKQESPNT